MLAKQKPGCSCCVALGQVESEGKRTFDYLYPNGDNMVLMETEPPTYEQVELPLTLLGDQAVFLKVSRTRYCRVDTGHARNG